MELLDCRRLTGPNAIWDRAGAVLDIACDDDEAGATIAALADIRAVVSDGRLLERRGVE